MVCAFAGAFTLSQVGCTQGVPPPDGPSSSTLSSPEASPVDPNGLVVGEVARVLTSNSAASVEKMRSSTAVDIPGDVNVIAVDPLGNPIGLGPQRVGSTAGQDVALLSAMTIGRVGVNGVTPVAETLKDPFGVTGNYDQITAADGDGEWVVWVETPSTDLQFQEWVIRAVGKSGVVRELARSTSLPMGQRFPDCLGGTRPVIAGAWVYWATAVPTVPAPRLERPSDWRIDVLRTKLAVSSAVETVARDAVMPVAQGDGVVFLQRLTTPEAGYEVRRISPTGESVALATGRDVGGYAPTVVSAGRDAVAWMVGRPTSGPELALGYLFVHDLHSGKTIRIDLGSDGGEGSSMATSVYGPVWGSGSGSGDAGEYLYDLKRSVIVRLGESEGYSVVVANQKSSIVAWAQPGAERPHFIARRLG
jgi:hypothetical protein